MGVAVEFEERLALCKEKDKLNVGLSYLKREGKPMHPSDIYGEMTEDYYNRQLVAYYDGIEFDTK